MRYTFYGTKKYIKWEFRKHDIWKDYFIPLCFNIDEEEPQIRHHEYKQEEIRLFDEITDFDYTSLENVEYKGETYSIKRAVKVIDEDEVKVYINYIDNEEIGLEDARKKESEYKMKKETKKEILDEINGRNWLKKLFKIKS